MFHDADQGRFGTPRNAFDLLCNHDFEEMLWENNTLVMRRRNNKAQHGGDPVLGFTPFFDYQDQSVNDVNARAVPEDHHDTARTTSVFMSNKDNYVPSTTNCNNNPLFGSGFGSENIADPSSYVRSSKRSSEDWNNNNPTTIRKLDNKKLKATVDNHQPNNDFIAPQGDSLVPDEFPQPNVAAVARKAIESGDRLVPGPGTSIVASNDALPPWTMGTIYEESDNDSEYPDSEEDRERRARRTPQSRSSSLHSRSEKKRRDRINKKMRALQVLLPNCNNKVDQASVLDEAIEYIKTLQFQLQLLSAGGSHMFPSPMMVPPPLPQIPMNQFVGMGFAMGPGFGHQFPMSGFRRFMPCFPFMPWPSPRSEMPGPAIVPDVSGITTTTSIDQIGSNYAGYPKEFLRPRDK